MVAVHSRVNPLPLRPSITIFLTFKSNVLLFASLPSYQAFHFVLATVFEFFCAFAPFLYTFYVFLLYISVLELLLFVVTNWSVTFLWSVVSETHSCRAKSRIFCFPSSQVLPCLPAFPVFSLLSVPPTLLSIWVDSSLWHGRDIDPVYGAYA